MFLSNLCRTFLLIAVCAALLQACGGTQTAQNKEISLNGEPGSEFPFATKEPEVYQGDFVTIGGGVEDRYFVARKGDKWRYDVFSNGAAAMSEIRSDKLYAVDHQKKIYWEIPDDKAPAADVSDITRGFFRGNEHRDLDEVSREGNLVKYKIRESGETKGDVFVTVDTASGMMVKQEFFSPGKTEPEFVYEIKNLKTDVDDNVFSIPNGYRRVDRDEKKGTAPKK